MHFFRYLIGLLVGLIVVSGLMLASYRSPGTVRHWPVSMPTELSSKVPK